MKRTRMKQGYTPDPEHDEWRRQVLERDNYTCRWPGCRRRGKKLHAHHINERSQRPDLRYEVTNGATLCGEHHDYAHHDPKGRAKAIELGLLGGTTYELAQKNRTLGQVVSQ